MDNRAAGETAAYLIGEWLGGGAGAAYWSPLSSNRFRGEEEREIGFRQALRDALSRAWHRRGKRRPRHRPRHRRARARGLARASRHRRRLFDRRGQSWLSSRLSPRSAAPAAFSSATISMPTISRCCAPGASAPVLHHDLGQDMRNACLHVMRAHGAAAEIACVGPWPTSRSSRRSTCRRCRRGGRRQGKTAEGLSKRFGLHYFSTATGGGLARWRGHDPRICHRCA